MKFVPLFNAALVAASMLQPSATYAEKTAMKSELWHQWNSLATQGETTGNWGYGPGERFGQICDPWRSPEDETFDTENDLHDGCVVVWLSEPADNFTVKHLPRDQQNNFQNTQHYKQAWNYHGAGFHVNALPRPGHDINPVCFLTTQNITYPETCGNFHIRREPATYAEAQISCFSEGYTLAKVDVESMEVLDALLDHPTHEVARLKPSEQSSTSHGGVAGRAVDGLTDDTSYNQGSCTHTHRESNPWWRVDLETEQNITSVKLWNRRDCCSNRLDGAEIRVSITDNVEDAEICATVSSIGAGASGAFACQASGRFVFVVIPGNNKILTLCEVQVEAMAPESSGINYWIGADKLSGDGFRWGTDGAPVELADPRWYPGEPNDATEACLTIKDGEFQDSKCNERFHYVCVEAACPGPDAPPHGPLTLGFEEPNGDRLLQCPGANGGPPVTEDMLMEALGQEDPLIGASMMQDYCEQCFQGVCTESRSKNPQNCGRDGVEVGQGNNDDNVVDMYQQAGSSYHCHLTMANEGACDYVQYDQHEDSRTYHGEYGVLCGWEQIRYLNITDCDCTREAGTANNCQRMEGLRMALHGVVCGNCNNFDQNRARDQIFGIPEIRDARSYAGVCALATTAEEADEREHYRMMCSQGLFCRNNNLNTDGCRFHCEHFPEDPKCPTSTSSARKLLGMLGF
eukprot:CAMPEP_0197849790 /NCGR_PEP_ID=MMETSP1438-20131217/13210_1 /TAXON_ID=1461541 /ORGANISM="Pterosperma sp., Strain CCMP1384" /LENGTH=687 /DNA_ID=CAMNT_0043462629 /DNA_START=158 /DNA_END=2221 /DNA_ORIENTATION=+